MKKTVKEQTNKVFQVGGYVNPQVPYRPSTPVSPQTGTYKLTDTGIAGYTSPTQSTTGFTPYVAPVIPGSNIKQATSQLNYTQATGTTNLPTFGQTIGLGAGKYDEFKTYVNTSGQILRIPFIGGNPIYPIPEGYRLQVEDTTTVTNTSTVPTTMIKQNKNTEGTGEGFANRPSVTGKKNTSLGLTDYFSGAPAEAQPYDPLSDATLGSLNAQGMVSYDPKGNVIGPSVTDFSNNIAAVQDALGVYGTGPISLGILSSLAFANPLGALSSASGIGPSTEAFGQAAPAGFGAFSTDQLNGYVSGKMSPIEMQATGIGAMDKAQAVARASVQNAIGAKITGVIGYNIGDISPITGTPINKYGQVVNFNGSTTGVSTGFTSMSNFKDAIEAAIKTGYLGGWKSKAEVLSMTKKERSLYGEFAKYRKGDPAGQGSGTGVVGEASIAGTPEGGFNPTGRQSATGRQDYSGGITFGDTKDNGNSSSKSGGGGGSNKGGPPGEGGSGYAQGGLTKQTKRSGLASKK